MKLLMALLLVGTNSFAAIVGDKINYSGTFDGKPMQIESVVTTITAGSTSFTYKSTITTDGQTRTETGNSDDQIIDFTARLAVDANACRQFGINNHGSGIIETLTISGKNIPTCHAHIIGTYDDGTTAESDDWYGDIPVYGIAKTMTKGNLTHPAMALTLVSFLKN